MSTLATRSLLTFAPLAVVLALTAPLSGCSRARQAKVDSAETAEVTPDPNEHHRAFLDELTATKESAEAFMADMRPVAGKGLPDRHRNSTGSAVVRIAVSADEINLDNVSRVEEVEDEILAADLHEPEPISLLKRSRLPWAQQSWRSESQTLPVLHDALLDVHEAERGLRYLTTGTVDAPGGTQGLMLAEVHAARDVPCERVMAVLYTVAQAQFVVLEGAEEEMIFECMPGLADGAEASPVDPMAEDPPPPGHAFPSLSVSSLHTRVEGNLSVEAVQEVVDAHRSQILDCYRDAYRRRPSVRGHLEMTWRIDIDGTVTDARMASSTIDDSTLHDCIAHRIETWRFQPSEGQGAIVVQSWSLAPATGR